MTVVAYKAGRMACDGLCVNLATGVTFSKGNKIARTKAGALIGQSGDADARALLVLLDNVKAGDKMPTAAALAETKCEGGFIIALPNNEVWGIDIFPNPDMEEWSASASPVTGMHGIAHTGCGGEMALAFMRAGKTA